MDLNHKCDETSTAANFCKENSGPSFKLSWIHGRSSLFSVFS